MYIYQYEYHFCLNWAISVEIHFLHHCVCGISLHQATIQNNGHIKVTSHPSRVTGISYTAKNHSLMKHNITYLIFNIWWDVCISQVRYNHMTKILSESDAPQAEVFYVKYGVRRRKRHNDRLLIEVFG